MASASNPKPSRIKVREHRERLREQGLRPIQIWVPDVRLPTFRSEAYFQSLAVATSRHASKDQAFIDAVSDGVKRAAYRLMVNKITTVPTSKIGAQVGKLDDDDILKLNQALLVFLRLAGSPRSRRAA